MMEQALDTAAWPLSNNISGSPIRYVSKDPSDPRLEVDLGANDRRNKDEFQRIIFPFYDRPGLETQQYNQQSYSNTSMPAFPNSGGNNTRRNPETLDEFDLETNEITPKTKVNPNLKVDLPGVMASRKVVKPGFLRDKFKK